MTAAQAKAAFDAAEDFSPEQPRPLRREMPPADPFPVDALGGILGPAARGIEDRVQAPAAICAQSILAAASLAVQGHADVELPTGHVRPTSEFFVTIAASGERKSTCDGEALWPVRKFEEALRTKYDADLPSWQDDKESWEKQRAQILKDKKKYPDRGSKRQALADLGPAPSAPLVPLLTCPEPTFEGLCRLLVSGHPSVGLFSSEGGQFIGGHGMNDDNKLKTAAALSGVWDGEPIRRVRAGDGVVMLPGRRVALHLMAQPDVAAVLLSDRILNDQGLLSRFLVTAPATTCGTRLWHDPRPESDTAIKRYGARMSSIFETPFSVTEGKANELIPSRLPLAAKARNAWIAFADHVERSLAPGGELEPVRGLANKLPEHAARLAAILALVDDIHAPVVSPEQIGAGIELAQHYAVEALRLFEAGAVCPDIRLAGRLLAWLTVTWTEPVVSLPDIYRLGPNAIREKATASRIVAVLEDHGWLQRVPGGCVVAGNRRRDAWHVVGEC
jgi:hypothetical protein